MKIKYSFLVVLLLIIPLVFLIPWPIANRVNPAEQKIKSVTIHATPLGRSQAHIISYPNGGAYYVLTVLARQTEVGLNARTISLRIERDFSVANSWKYTTYELAYMEAVIDSALRAGESIQFLEIKSDITGRNHDFSGVAWRDQQILFTPSTSAISPAYIKTYPHPRELQSLDTPPRSKSKELD